jgi:hypothetical protein
MNEREAPPSAWRSREGVDESQETLGNINDVLRTVRSVVWSYVRERWPDFSEDGKGMAEHFCQDFLSLINPSADQVRLSREQRVFLRVALFDAWTFKGYPRSTPSVDRNKVLGVATYLNSLALLQQHR